MACSRILVLAACIAVAFTMCRAREVQSGGVTEEPPADSAAQSSADDQLKGLAEENLAAHISNFDEAGSEKSGPSAGSETTQHLTSKVTSESPSLAAVPNPKVGSRKSFSRKIFPKEEDVQDIPKDEVHGGADNVEGSAHHVKLNEQRKSQSASIPLGHKRPSPSQSTHVQRFRAAHKGEYETNPIHGAMKERGAVPHNQEPAYEMQPPDVKAAMRAGKDKPEKRGSTLVMSMDGTVVRVRKEDGTLQTPEVQEAHKPVKEPRTRGFSTQSNDGARVEGSQDDEEVDDEAEIQKLRQRVREGERGKLTKTDRQKLLRHAKQLSPEEHTTLHKELGLDEQMDPNFDPGVCYNEASAFCRGLLYSYSEFLLCTVRERDKFTTPECVKRLAEAHELCAPDMVRLCPNMASQEAIKCFVDPKVRSQISEECLDSMIFEAFEGASKHIVNQKADAAARAAKRYANDPEALKALKDLEQRKQMPSETVGGSNRRLRQQLRKDHTDDEVNEIFKKMVDEGKQDLPEGVKISEASTLARLKGEYEREEIELERHMDHEL